MNNRVREAHRHTNDNNRLIVMTIITMMMIIITTAVVVVVVVIVVKITRALLVSPCVMYALEEGKDEYTLSRDAFILTRASPLMH